MNLLPKRFLRKNTHHFLAKENLSKKYTGN